MGEQSPALDRHRRRSRMGHDVQRLGSNLADSKAHHRLEQSERGERDANARAIGADGPHGPARLAHKLLPVIPVAVLYGGGKSLSDVWGMRCDVQPRSLTV